MSEMNEIKDYWLDEINEVVLRAYGSGAVSSYEIRKVVDTSIREVDDEEG